MEVDSPFMMLVSNPPPTNYWRRPKIIVVGRLAEEIGFDGVVAG